MTEIKRDIAKMRKKKYNANYGLHSGHNMVSVESLND